MEPFGQEETMPIYEYACEPCQRRFEALVMRSDEAVQCPDCHGTQLKKLISAHAVGHAHQAAPACPVTACGTGACPACH